MVYLCHFCGKQRSVVYCRSDAASLCLSCDSNVHSANALSRRHLRTLVCERCNSQPAFVRCMEEKVSLCQNCDWMGHAGSSISSVHKRQAINCYSGCPSASELSAVWPFLLDSPSVGDSTCVQGIGLMSITDNSATDSQHPQGKSHIQDGALLREASDRDNENVDKSTVWMESLNPFLEPRLQDMDQPAGSTSSADPKVFLSRAKGHAVCEDDGFCGNINMDEVELGIEDYDELFCTALDSPGNLFGDDGIFGTKDMSESKCQGAYAAEGSSVGVANMMQPASADSVISCKTEPNLYFARPANSGLSFSGVTGESSGGDYQDCGVSSMPITGEPPWYPPGPESSMPPTSRSDAVMRYKEKKAARKFEKKVRYASRKARADVRRRVKGRFVKAGEPYDYDPLCPSKSY